MTFALRVENQRLIAVQTGSLDWQDTDRAFDRCEAVLSDHPQITQLLLDLGEARLDLTPTEAAQLAGIVTLTFSRKITTAIVSPPEPDAFALVSHYAASLRTKGVPVEACKTRESALRFLDGAERSARRMPCSLLSRIARGVGLRLG